MWYRNRSVSDMWLRKILTPATSEYAIGNRTDCSFHGALFYPQCEAFFVLSLLSLWCIERNGTVLWPPRSPILAHVAIYLWRAQFASEWQHGRPTLSFDWSCCGNSTSHAVKFSATREFLLTQVSFMYSKWRTAFSATSVNILWIVWGCCDEVS